MLRSILIALTGFCLTTTAVVAQTAPTDGRSIASIAHATLRLPDGSHSSVAARVETSKPTLIAFWASWCLPCLAEAPRLAALRRRFGDRFNFLYINRRDGDPDPRQPPPAIDQFLARASLSSADYVVADTATYRQIVGADMAALPDGIVGIPRVYLFDRHGRQVYTALGFSEAKSNELEQRLRDLVAAHDADEQRQRMR